MLKPCSPPSPLFPLDTLHTRAGRPLPSISLIPPSELPPPYRQLLDHPRDMTRTLERHHGRSIHLRVLSQQQSDNDCWREVVLTLDDTLQPVEFGAIRIRLAAFPEPWRSQILEGQRPLGAILNASGIQYSSKPSAFLRLTADDFVAQALHTPVHSALFGRQNTLRNEHGEVLAEIVEILPPAPQPQHNSRNGSDNSIERLPLDAL